MYIPVKIEATNFQSFESLSYSFRQGQSTLIQGENLSDDGQESNGSGKSTLQEIVYYCLIGSSSTGKRDFKLIRRGCNEANVSITFYNSINQKYLRIERDLFLKKSSLLRIFINDECQKHLFSTVDDGNKLIIKLIGVSSDDLKNFYLINREKFTPFFKLSDTQSRELVSRFSNISFMPKLEGAVNSEVEEEEKELQSLQKDLNSIETSITSYSSKIEALQREVDIIKENSSEERIKEVKLRTISTIRQGIVVFEKEIECYINSSKLIDDSIEQQKQLKLDCEINRNCILRAIDRISNIDYSPLRKGVDDSIQKLDSEISILKKESSTIEAEISLFKKELSNLNTILSGEVICPKCEHRFVPGEGFDLDEVKETIKEVDSAILNLQSQLLLVEKQISEVRRDKLELEKSIEKISKQQGKKNRVISNLERSLTQFSVGQIDSKISSLIKEGDLKNSEIVKLRFKIQAENLKIKNIEEEDVDNSLVIKNLEESVNNNKDLLVVSEQKKKEIELEIEGQINVIENKKIWLLYFKQFYIYLTNQCLKTIQDLCNKFLEQIDTDLRVQVDGFKYLSSGTVKESITVSILRGGLIEDDYRSFSGGERGKLILSTILSFQELINNNSPTGGIDLLFIDEILDSVDGLGMQNFILALNNLTKTIYLTTHISIKGREENVLLIRKINDKSYIV